MHNGIAAGVAVVSLTIGAASGYYYAVKKLNDEYNAKMEDEIARTKKHYQRVYDKEDLETTAFKAGIGEAAEALKEYQGGTDTGTIFTDDGPVPVEVVEAGEEKNIFDDGDELRVDKENRDPDKPYVIDIGEYLDTPDKFEQLELTYYAGDAILGDDKDEPIPDFNVDPLIGRANLMLFGASDPEQPHVVLVRNEKMKMDFEITHSDGKFAHEVAGLQHSDEPFQRTRPRPRREE